MVDLNSRRYPGTEQRRTTHWRKLPHPITANLTLNLIETKFWRTTTASYNFYYTAAIPTAKPPTKPSEKF